MAVAIIPYYSDGHGCTQFEDVSLLETSFQESLSFSILISNHKIKTSNLQINDTLLK